MVLDASLSSTKRFSAHEEKILRSLIAAAMPSGELVGGGDGTLDRLYEWLEGGSTTQLKVIQGLLWSVEGGSITKAGRPFTMLSRDRAEALLDEWTTSSIPVVRSLARTLMAPLKSAYFDDPNLFRQVGLTHGQDLPLLVQDESPRFMQQVTDGKQAAEDLELACEVVVVGTGAGGAACAYELARKGRAVVLVEEGDYHKRSSFTSRASEMAKRLYRDRGMTVAFGNINAPVWAGCAVGGSTVINSGTCYRAPDRVLSRWRDELQIGLSSEVLAPYYERVEAMLDVEPAPMNLAGGIGRVIARGAEKLGYSHHTLNRNAPGCDGSGVCCFGCPTGAKRSTDVSYVPEALKRGAQLVTAAKVDRVLVHDRKAAGVSGVLGSGRSFTIKADAVVLACGALMTPVVMKEARVCSFSPAVGKNLSIHPATRVMAMFDEVVDMGRGIPQGYCVDEFSKEGIVFEGASTPLDVTALSVPWVGRRFMNVIEQYRHIANFGFMIEDTSRGQVRRAPNGSPLITYHLNSYDTDRMIRAVSILSRIFFEAGARRVMPFLPGMDELQSIADVDKITAKKWSASALEVTAYHPLGTCRMGIDPKTSVVGPTHETHEIERLYIADGSVVPTALGVNPQMTIMAMALRAAEFIDTRLG